MFKGKSEKYWAMVGRMSKSEQKKLRDAEKREIMKQKKEVTRRNKIIKATPARKHRR